LNPENAAQSLVESLESRGYKYDEKDGIKGGASVSTNGESDRYRSSLSKDESSSYGKGRSWGEEAVAVFRAKGKPLFDNESLGSGQGSKDISQTDSVFRAKVKVIGKYRNRKSNDQNFHQHS
jgi:hypothetical protein